MRGRIILCCVLLGCGAEAPPSTAEATGAIAPTLHDSAGITLAAHERGAIDRAATITLDSAPLAVIAGSIDDPTRDVSTMRPITFLADGRLVAVEPTGGLIKLFTADGQSWEEFGRKGSGPGELGMVYEGHWTAGDTVVFTDISNGRVVEFDPRDGSISTTPLVHSIGMGARTVVGRIGDRLVTEGSFALETPDPAARVSEPRGIKLVLLPRSGDDPELIYRSDPEPPPLTPTTSGGLVVVPALSPATMFVARGAVMSGDQLLLYDGSSWRFTALDSSGTVRRVISFDEPRVPLSDALWQTHIEATYQRLLAQVGEDVDSAQLRSGIASAVRPDSIPAWQRIDVSPNGTVWLLRYPVPGVVGWSAIALDREGRLLGQVHADSGDAPVLFGDDRALFRSENDLGIATFTVRALHIPGS